MARKTLKEMPNWLVKIYRFNAHLSPDGYSSNRTNLCEFCRVVFLWVPLKLVVATNVVIAVSFAILYLFFVMVPDIGWAVHWVVWSLAIGAFIFWYLADNYKTPADMWKSTVAAVPGPPQWWKDLLNVLGAWWDAIHDRICPLIELKDEEN